MSMRSWRRPIVAASAGIEVALTWLLAHVTRVWPAVALGLVALLTWDAWRSVRPAAVRAAINGTDARWLLAALAATVANLAAMGFYDVLAFRRTRAPWTERWQFGAVAFAWSNFLTLGPLAGPAIRLWLYRPSTDRIADLQGGIVLVGIAFVSGLIGWTIAALVVPPVMGAHWPLVALIAFVLIAVAIGLSQQVARRIDRLSLPEPRWTRTLGLAGIGWVDWLLAWTAFLACLSATGGHHPPAADILRPFFFGQTVGLVSLIPGGLGSADAFWIAHLGAPENVATAALIVYRAVYYVAPWTAASLVLLSWATRRGARRLQVARRVLAALVGGAGVLIMLSAASPALATRLAVLERLVPLALVEAGHLTASLVGLLLLVLARGLAKGYRAALRATVAALALASAAALLKGLDWEEASILGAMTLALSSQAALFDRPSHGAWLERRDFPIIVGALAVFLALGAATYPVSAAALTRWTHLGYRVQAMRFVRSAATAVLVTCVTGLYLLLRVPVSFRRLSDDAIERAIEVQARIGGGSTPLMVANGDKDVFFDGERGFCLYRTIGPYLVVLGDPIVRADLERAAFLEALVDHASGLDRRPLFYQVSLEWVPPLHDRGYGFFKLGEEAQVPLDRVTLEGHAGKRNRQILRRADRDGLTFRVVPADGVAAIVSELGTISREWLQVKNARERQFSIGFFDERYLRRFPCAIVERLDRATNGRRLVAFANMLEDPRGDELSVDLMRYGREAPGGVMDFLLLALMLHARAQGFARFNLGMAPLATVGETRGAHVRERLAHLLFQHGETWYNFQGLRQYKQKFDPQWAPRYMAYQNAWEWPAAIAHVSALIAGGWRAIFLPTKA